MSTHQAPTNRLRFPASPGGGSAAASRAARDSIISSSAKGWSPLQINKRDGTISPLRQSPHPSPNPNPNLASPPSNASEGPRRTSNSFKHVTKNSLVNNSPFKSLATVQGRQAAGMDLKGKEVIHERRNEGRKMGESQATAEGAGATPRAAIGLGISAKPRSTSRSASGSKSAVPGTRKVSSEKGKISMSDRRVSGERRVSGDKSKENESPNLHPSQRSRQTSGVKGLKEGNHVSKSPFVVARGGELSPNPSPKTIPSRQQTSLSLSPSPSPHRVTQRKVSPAHRRTSRGSPAHTPSPPRHFSHSNSLATASPLSKQNYAVSPRTAPGPKSALTPSRRLLGPRHALGNNDSPSKQAKTVTFQSVPDVKEFESQSVEGSADGSFEVDLDVESEYERDWVDEAVERLDGEDNSAQVSGLDEIMDRLQVAETSQSPQSQSSNSHSHQDESTTADFVNTLIEEGLFSPNQTPALGSQDTPAFEDQPVFEPSSTEESQAPYLSTPSLGDENLMSPMFGDTAETTLIVPAAEKDPDAPAPAPAPSYTPIAHSLPPISIASPLAPVHDLSNVRDPKIGVPPVSTMPTEKAMHLNDPFASNAAIRSLPPINHQTSGTSSHSDRINMARALATQKLGLGMPRSPGRTASEERDEDAGSESGSEVDSGSDDDDRFYGNTTTPVKIVTATTRAVVAQTAVQSLETPNKGMPRPQEVNVPTPLQTPTAAGVNAEKRSSKLDFSGFALPLINMTSPFFRGTPQLDSQPRVPSNETSSQSTEDESRPITPPAARQTDPAPASSLPKEDSAHRIPSFEFEEISLSTEEMLVRKATITKNPHSPVKTVFPNPFDQEPLSPVRSRPVQAQAQAEAGRAKSPEGSMRVRQRISREMIRETIDRKYAEGSISRRPQSAMALPTTMATTTPPGAPPTSSSARAQVHTQPTRPVSDISPETKRMSQYGGYSTTVAPPTLSASSSAASGSGKDKDLPPPPAGATPMLKSATEVPRTAVPPALAHRPRSNTQATAVRAGEMIQRSSQMGNEPSSSLDRIIAGQVAGSAALPPLSPLYGPTANIGRPISILQTPHAPIAAPNPVRADSTPTASAGMISSVSREFGPSASRARDGSGMSKAQEGSRRSRRSMSMGAADEETRPPTAVRKQPRLTLGLGREDESIVEAFRDELESISGDRKYKVREKHVLAASFVDTVSHSKAGDIDTGKAWRQLRRPSDINEHAAEIRAMRDREVSHGKASGTIFVKVLGIESLVVPVPSQPTFFCMTLDNGIDYIRTPYTALHDGARVNQEFALVEHPNFEFSLSMDVRRDPHIIRALQDQNQLDIQSRIPSLSNGKPTQSGGGSGIRNLFSSPRKPKCTQPQSRSTTPLPPPPAQLQAQPDSIARYLATPHSSTIAKTHVAFKPIAKQCEAKVLEIRYPMFAMFKGEPDRPREGARGAVPPNTPRKQVAKVTLQVFRLPPLPGIKPDELPQCIDECLRGMRHHAWHECEYHEGNLTQEGGDCSIPRRRMFKLIGGNLVAYNEITRKEVATIDLRQATGLIDLTPPTQPGARVKRSATIDDEGMGMGIYGARPRSFKVEFKDGDGIVFSADRDEDKATWMETLQGLIGKIPSNPLWAELLSTKMREKADRATARSVSRSTMSHTSGNVAAPSGHGPSGQEKRREASHAMGKTRSAPAAQQGQERVSQQQHVQVQVRPDIGRDMMQGRKGEGVV